MYKPKTLRLKSVIITFHKEENCKPNDKRSNDECQKAKYWKTAHSHNSYDKESGSRIFRSVIFGWLPFLTQFMAVTKWLKTRLKFPICVVWSTHPKNLFTNNNTRRPIYSLVFFHIYQTCLPVHYYLFSIINKMWLKLRLNI